MLRFEISPDRVSRSHPGGVPDVVSLRLTVTNTGALPVPFDRLVFGLVPGDGPAELTDEEHVGAIVAAAQPGWYVRGDDAGGFSAVPRVPGFHLAAGASVGFDLHDVAVNGATGTATIAIGAPGAHAATVTVVKENGRPHIEFFEGLPTEIELGDECVLRWRTTGASHCTLVTPDGTLPVERTGSARVQPTTTYTYRLIAEGDGPPDTRPFEVVVAGMRIDDFRAGPDRVALGDRTTLRWLISGAASATVEPGGPVNRQHGTLTVPVHEDTDFTLTATRPGLIPVVASAPVTVVPVDLRDLTADPPVIPPGESTTLHWDAAWSTGYRLAWPGGAVDLDREATSYPLRPAATTTYTLTAAGLRPRSRELTVAVGAALTRLGLSTDPARPGAVLLHWQVRCGEARLGTGTTAEPPLAPVPAEDSRWLTLGPRPTYVRMLAGDRETRLILAGATAPGGPRFGSFDLTAPAGLTTPRTSATVRWSAEGGTVSGTVRDGDRSEPLSGGTGDRPAFIGARVAHRTLWAGNLMVEGGGAYAALDWEVL
ncbi:hypothetical protein ACFPIJ_09700 [Dactylosporangium cerinum]|uniref:Uncharacterized protein n=1 Tax=Dactylosporangium cerinum TaxID=1434730 RepID=A0ABV9VQZ9_9ACTN